MRKKITWSIVSIAGICLLSSVCYAMRLLDKEQALKKVLGEGVEIVTETKELVEPKLTTIKERLGGSLIFHKKGSQSAPVEEKHAVDFNFALKDGKKTAVAIIDEEPGKWGPIEFIIALNLDASVKQVEVLSYQERRGQPIARRSFLSQFEKKTSKDPIKVDKDINGISGATISSQCAVFSVRKAITLYEEEYLK